MVIGATILAVTAFTEINGADQNGNHEGGWDSLWAKYECAYAQDFKNSSETITGKVSMIILTRTVRGYYGPVDRWEPQKGGDPDTSYHVHFIFGVTSYQREKCLLHPITTSYHNHFILRAIP